MTVVSAHEIGTQAPRSVDHTWQLFEMIFAAAFTTTALLTLFGGGTVQQVAVVASGLLGAAAIFSASRTCTTRS